MKIREIHDKVCEVLLEDGGPSLGLISSEEILGYYVDAIQDFLTKTGIFKKLAPIRADLGVNGGVLPDWMSRAETLFYDHEFLQKTHLASLETNRREWMTRIATPEVWRADKMGLKEFEVAPAPRIQGKDVESALIPGFNGFYGVLSFSSAGPALEFNSILPFLGTIADDEHSSVFVETAGPFLGTIADASASPGNYLVAGPAALFLTEPELDDLVELIPDTLAIYIVFGALERVFASEGELHDEVRMQYCAARFREGISVVQAIAKDSAIHE